MAVIYTDGSQIPGQDGAGYAGMGIWFGVDDNRNESRYLDGNHITHQYAELKAIEVAIKYCRYIKPVEILSDSQYSINAINEWASTWEKNGWLTSKGEPVLYPEVIKSVRAMIFKRRQDNMPITIKYVKGHSNNIGNDGADKLAKAAAKKLEKLYMSNVIYFDGGRLGNFYYSNISTNYKDITQEFMCVEQFYQYHKAITFGDTKCASDIMVSDSQFVQRNIGQQVKGFDQAKWDDIKYDVMLYGVREKFIQHNDLKEYLISTNNSPIVEARPDKEWGIGISRADAVKGIRWNGKNLLGKVLMQVRHELI
jgi:ribA/ribD-fused uncharacterized protein